MLSVREISEVSCDDAVDTINDPASFSSLFDQVSRSRTAGHILIEMLKYFWRILKFSIADTHVQAAVVITHGWLGLVTRHVGTFHTRSGEVTSHGWEFSNIIAIILHFYPMVALACEIGDFLKRNDTPSWSDRSYCWLDIAQTIGWRDDTDI